MQHAHASKHERRTLNLTAHPTSNGHNAHIFNPNFTLFMFKLNLRMSTFQLNKPY